MMDICIYVNVTIKVAHCGEILTCLIVLKCFDLENQAISNQFA